MKIAFFDIDGTLLDVPHGLNAPSRATIEALKAFQDQGNKIVIASARGAVPASLECIFFDGYIFNDGHYIIYEGKVLVDDLFTQEMVQKQLDVYQKYHGRPQFAGHQGSWCNCLDDELIIKHRLMFAGTAKRPQDVVEHFTVADVKAVSCCVLFDTVEALEQAYHELEDQFTMIPYKTGLIRMDVYCKGFTKGTACQYLYRQLKIERENTYAFGDGENDIEMLQLVKHGIAMGNAVEPLKAVASEVTDIVTHDGIAKSFHKHFAIEVTS